MSTAERAIGGPGICRGCGCTDDDCSACVERTGHPCQWVGDGVCSACAGDMRDRLLHTNMVTTTGRAWQVAIGLLEALPGWPEDPTTQRYHDAIVDALAGLDPYLNADSPHVPAVLEAAQLLRVAIGELP